MFRSALLTCLCATLAGCAGSSAELTPVLNDQVTCEKPRPGPPLEIRYLGSGGHLIRRGPTAIMTAPFFSNPGLFRVGVGRISPDSARIDAAVEKIIENGGRLDDVQAILVGHAHYDHLLDVPRVWREYAPHAKIFGSLTAKHILRGFDIPDDQIETLNSSAASRWAPGRWVVVGDVRFMAIESEHAPHAFGIKLYGGEIRKDLDRPPRRATGIQRRPDVCLPDRLLGSRRFRGLPHPLSRFGEQHAARLSADSPRRRPERRRCRDRVRGVLLAG